MSYNINEGDVAAVAVMVIFGILILLFFGVLLSAVL